MADKIRKKRRSDRGQIFNQHKQKHHKSYVIKQIPFFPSQSELQTQTKLGVDKSPAKV